MPSSTPGVRQWQGETGREGARIQTRKRKHRRTRQGTLGLLYFRQEEKIQISLT